jgi:hypothetical protein
MPIKMSKKNNQTWFYETMPHHKPFTQKKKRKRKNTKSTKNKKQRKMIIKRKKRSKSKRYNGG